MKTGRMKKVRYSNEFKVTAVKLANHPDVQTQDVAASLNIHPFMLSRWKKEFHDGKLPDCVKEAGMQATTEEHKQIRALKEQVRRLQIENDLLKKAIQFDLEENQKSSG